MLNKNMHINHHSFRMALLGLLLNAALASLHAQNEKNSNFVYQYPQQVANNVKMVQGPNSQITVAANRRPGILVSQFNPSGSAIWSKKLQNAEGRLRFGDLGVGPAGHIWLAYLNGQALTITNFLPDGKINWQREYLLQSGSTNPVKPMVPHAVVPGDQGVTVYGFKTGTSDTSGYVLTLDEQGQKKSLTLFEAQQNNSSGVATRTADGEFIGGYGQALFKLNASRQVVFHRTYGGPYKQIVNMQALPDGGFYALLATPTGAQFTLLKVKGNGTLEWQAPELQIPGSASTQASGLALSPDNGALITGRVNTAGTTPRNLPAVIKVNPEGSLEFVHYFNDTVTPKPVYANAFSIMRLSSSQAQPYFIAGKSSQVPNSGELLLGRTNAIKSAPKCIRTQSFSEGTRTGISFQNAPLPLSNSEGLTVNANAGPSWQSATMERSAKCLACSAVEVNLGSDTTICPGTAITLSTDQLGASHDWNKAATDSNTITVTRPGQYTVLAETICGQAGDSIRINQFPDVPVNPSISPTAPDPGIPVTLSIENTDANYIEWQVDPTTKLTGPEVQHTYEEPGRYRPVLSYTGPNDCRMNDTLPEIPVLIFNLFMPDAFSPDQDGLNEIFKPHGTGLQRYELTIFNRWGEQVFSGVNKGWKGRISDQAAEAGQYLFRLKVRTVFQNLKFREGTLTLIR